MSRILKWPSLLNDRWQQLARRDRQMLVILGGFLLAVVLFSAVWQPTQQRLERAETLYQQRLSLASELRLAKPGPQSGLPLQAQSQSLSSRLSDSITAAGLELKQLDQLSDSLRLTLGGDARALLVWLEQTEREGARMQALSLEKRGALLEARVVWAVD